MKVKGFDYQAIREFVNNHLVVLDEDVQTEDQVSEEPTLEPIECTTFSDLVHRMKQTLEVNINLEMVLATIFAVKHSVSFKDLPVWLFIVGPPSSGKTTLVEQVTSDTEETYSLSKFKGLHSGWKETPDDDVDYGLIPKINKKCLIIKDFTTLLNSPRESREEIMGELRDAYDGSAAAEYRNNIAHKYSNINFSILACTTYEILGEVQDQAAMGERFLMMNIIDGRPNDTGMVYKAISNTLESLFETEDTEEDNLSDAPVMSRSKTELRQASLGFMQTLKLKFKNKPKLLIPKDIQKKITNLSQFVSFMRTKVSRKKNNRQLEYRPVREFAGRLAIQLTKTAVCLAYVLGKKSIDNDVMAIIYKIAKDTCQGFSQEIVMALYDSDEGLTITESAEMAQTSRTTARQKLLDLIELNVVELHKGARETATKPQDVFCLTDDFYHIMDVCFAEPPQIPETFAKEISETKKPSRKITRKKGRRTTT